MNKSNKYNDSNNNNNILPFFNYAYQAVLCVLASTTRIDIWTIMNRKRAEFDHRYIFRTFWKYFIIQILAYSYLWSFFASFYRLGLHQLISNLMGIPEQRKQENTSETTEQQNNTKKYYKYRTATYWADNIKFKTRKLFQ